MFSYEGFRPTKIFFWESKLLRIIKVYTFANGNVCDILTNVHMLASKPSSFPIEQNHQLGKTKGSLLTRPDSYRLLVDYLVYLEITRPNLAYSMQVFLKFMHTPRKEHWDASLRVLWYLKSTLGQGLFLRVDSDMKLRAFCDCNWDSCSITRLSLTAFFVSLGHSSISWKSKKQHIVSHSSADIEYRSMVLHDLWVPQNSPTLLFCDNQTALHIFSNPVFNKCTKHI